MNNQQTFIKLYKTYLAAKYDRQGFPVDSHKFQRIDLSLNSDHDRVIARNQAINEYLIERNQKLGLNEHIERTLAKEFEQNQSFIKSFDKAASFVGKSELSEEAFSKYTDELRSFTLRNNTELNEIDKLYKGPTITIPENKHDLDLELTSLSIYEKEGKYMICRDKYFEDEKDWKPINDLSGPYETSEQAKKDFEKIKEFRDLMDGIGTNNLKVIAGSYEERIDDDPKNEIKAGIIRDFIKHDRKEPEKEISIEETKIIEFHTFK